MQFVTVDLDPAVAFMLVSEHCTFTNMSLVYIILTSTVIDESPLSLPSGKCGLEKGCDAAIIEIKCVSIHF